MNDCCCREKLRLLLQYRDAADLHSARVALLADIASGLLPRVEFALLSRSASQAHEKCMEARGHFLKHVEEHGC